MARLNCSSRRFVFGSLGFVAGLGFLAAEAADQTNQGIEVVTVTANKRTENAQDVSLSIVNLGDAVLNKTSSATLGQLQQYVPGMTISNVGGNLTSNTYLRGDGTNQLNAGADPAVAYFEDEVYISGKSGLQFDLLDIQSIDILKGPQGTLFGRNAAAGAINITTLKPSDQFSFTSDTTIGDYLLAIERASVTGPVDGTGGHLLYRFSIGYERRNGFTDNIAFNSPDSPNSPVDNISHLAARGQLEWVDNSFTFLLSVEGQNLRDGQTPSVISSAADTQLLPFPKPLPPPFNCPGINHYHQCYDTPGSSGQDLYGVTGRLDWTTGIGVLTSLTAIRHSLFQDAMENDGTDVPFLASAFYEFDNQFSEELRLANTDEPNARIRWVGGLYYLNAENRANGFYSVGGGAFTENDFNRFGLNSYAAFGQVDFDVTDQLTLTAGLRYTDDVKQDYRIFSVSGFPLYTVTPDGKWDALSPSATISYKINPDVRVYASYRQGWISGGFQDLFPQTAAAANTAFNPEKANSYTAGLKSTWLDNTLQVNAEGFWVDYSQMQVQQTEPIGGAGGFAIVTNNAGSARDQGVDLSVTTIPIPKLTLTADMTLQDARYTNYVSPPGAPPASAFDYTGNRIPDQPDFSTALSAQYAFEMANDGTLLVRGEYNYRTRYFAHPANPNAPGLFQPAFGLLNFRITYVPPSDAWELEFWGKNLTNTIYYNSISVGTHSGGPALESALAQYGEPITFGAQFHFHLQ